MGYFPCPLCNKQFKTTQHLNQHKNRKKSCSLSITNTQNSIIVDLPKKELNDKSEILNLKLNDILELVKSVQDYKTKIKYLESENNKLKEQLSIIKNVVQNTNDNVYQFKGTQNEINNGNLNTVHYLPSLPDTPTPPEKYSQINCDNIEFNLTPPQIHNTQYHNTEYVDKNLSTVFGFGNN